MKALIAYSIFLLVGCSPNVLPKPDGCTKDSECKGDRVCVDGECISPGTTPGTSSSASPIPTGSASASNKLACGETPVLCNCNSTSAYPGQVTQTPLCQSGYHQFEVCGQCAGGGAAWLTRCVCQ